MRGSFNICFSRTKRRSFLFTLRISGSPRLYRGPEGDLDGPPAVSVGGQVPDTNVSISPILGIVPSKWLVHYVRCVKLLKFCGEDVLVEILYGSLARCNTHLNPARHVIDERLKLAG